jgi:iron(III) transport system substrate-binding protein
MKRLALVLLFVAALAGCGGDDEGASDTLTVYSGREEELVEPLFERFEEETGIEVEVRYGDSAELAATIAEEGDNSPADVFFAQDPGSLGAVEGQLAELPEDVLTRVDGRFRDADGHWVGTSGRARVIVYNTDELTAAEVPDSVFELTDPKWKLARVARGDEPHGSPDCLCPSILALTAEAVDALIESV